MTFSPTGSADHARIGQVEADQRALLTEAERVVHRDEQAAGQLLGRLGPASGALQARADVLHGQLLRERGDHFEALARVRAGHQGWLVLGNRTEVLRAELDRASILVRLGDFTPAIQAGERLLDGLGELGPVLDRMAEVSRLHASTQHLLGLAREGLGQGRDALMHLDTAANMFDALDDEHGLALVRMSRAQTLLGLGMAHGALEELRRAERALAEHGSRRSRLRCLIRIAGTYHSLGQVSRALALLDWVRGELTGLEDGPEEAALLLAEGSAWLAAGLLDESERRAAQAHRLFGRLSMRHEAAQAQLLCARASIAGGQLDKADAELRGAAALFEESGATAWQCRVWATQAQRAAQAGQRDQAIELAERVLATSATAHPRTVARTRLVLAELCEPEVAARHLHDASTAVLTLRSRSLVIETGLARAAHHRRTDRAPEAIDELRSVMHHVRKTETVDRDALVRVADRTRVAGASNTLIDLLLAQGRHRSLIEAWQWAHDSKSIEAAGPPPVFQLPRPVDGESAVRPTDLKDLLDPALDAPAAVVSPDPLPLPAVPSVPLLEFHLLGDDLVTFVIRERQVHVHRLPWAAPTVRDLVRRWQQDCLLVAASRTAEELTGLAEDSRAETILAEMYDLLIAPVAELLTDLDEPLLVVAHRHLHAVPFDALVEPDGGRLGDRVALRFTTGHTAWSVRPTTDGPNGASSALVLAVPDGDAPLIEAEAELVGALLPGAEVHVGAEASSTVLADRAGAADIVHIACHGMFRSGNPLFSALRLGDRWITAHELTGIDLRGALVVLSACSSGVVSAADDEPVGLVGAALAAGARGVVAAGWVADDAVTLAFMRAFYALVASGADPEEAVAGARHAIAGEHPHPYLWAPFRYFSPAGSDQRFCAPNAQQI